MRLRIASLTSKLLARTARCACRLAVYQSPCRIALLYALLPYGVHMGGQVWRQLATIWAANVRRGDNVKVVVAEPGILSFPNIGQSPCFDFGIFSGQTVSDERRCLLMLSIGIPRQDL